ncbi:MAG TPA: M23 family metallopeptidase, partial [Candidatus Limnocylindrales bacterium]|nr:M23 family metallopeptidase [Candidatus Limnocylindrales bacterium]
MPRLLAIALLALPVVLPTPTAQSQPFSPCGVVDAIDYPIDISDTLAQGYDDFGVYRPRFGGNHVAVDIGFDRWGTPIHAAARGRVTLANLEEWDTEKGVVIIEHTFPDGSIAYTLYGHVDQGDGGMLPIEGSCVERGDVIALEGWPSRGKPHLHYEIRSMLPSEGGPGYIDGNPLDAGWFHPLEFTELWRTRLQPGFLSVQSFPSTPTLPPVLLDDGSAVLTLGDQLVSYLDGVERWRISLGNIATGLLGLS